MELEIKKVTDVLKQTKLVYITFYSYTSIHIMYQEGSPIFIYPTDLQYIVDFLREQNKQITWFVKEDHFGTVYGKSYPEVPKKMLNYMQNGDNLHISRFAEIQLIEDLLEAFKSVRFNTIRIDIHKDDELLQFIYEVTRATIYYESNNEWTLFEPNN
jgi:hypothetical protein